MTGGLTVLVAAACGAVVANLYYAQPIVTDIAVALGIEAQNAGTITTLTQLGYCLGLLFIVPLGDLLENRKLSLTVLGVGCLAALLMASTASAALFAAAALTLGIGSVSVQILLPFAAALSTPERQGLVVGRVMAGILTGIMLSRPLSSLIAGLLGWRAVFGMAAAASLVAALVILVKLPARQPSGQLGYGSMLRSMAVLVRDSALLRRRAFYQFLMFYSYTLFWTAVPVLLAGPAFGLDQTQFALFALAGAAGAIMSPLAGRMADRGLAGVGTGFALLAGTLSWAVAYFGLAGGSIGLAVLVVAALVLDGAVPMSLVMGQRELFASAPDQRARLNGLFIAAFFLGGAIGASLGTWSVHRLGWTGTVAFGAIGPALALAAHLASSFKQDGNAAGRIQ